MIQVKNSKTGFALLISMIVVGVVVSVGLSILELTIKQLALATNSKDSEIALHAANAGLECAQYWRNKEFTKFENGDTVSATCFGNAPAYTKSHIGDDVSSASGVTADLGNAYKYSYEFDWGTPSVDERCSVITMLILVSDNESTGGVRVDDISDFLSGYDNNTVKTCDPGGRCTFTSVQGYNKKCSDKGSFGTIQREVLLES